MEHKDSDFTGQVNSEQEESYFNEQEYSPLKRKKKSKFGSRVFKMPEGIPFSWFGIGSLILIILLMLVLGGTRGTVTGLDKRLKKLEQRIDNLQDVDDKVTQVLEQAQAFEQFKERFDRLEASMTLRMDHVVKGLKDLQKKVAESRPKKTVSSRPAKVAKKTAKKRYHTVRRGETLYSISRKYSLTVNKIRILNKLSDRALIHPGQKLLVGS